MYIEGVTHVAIDFSWPSRIEHFLREAFGLQTLRHGYLKGDYVRIMGSPDPGLANPGFVALHLRTGIPEGRLNHIGFAVRNMPVSDAVTELQQRGIYVDVDGGDRLYGPEDLCIQLDSYTHPKPSDPGDETIKMQECPIDPQLPCLVRGIHHVAIEVAAIGRMQDWLCDTFGMDNKRSFMRRGEYIAGVSYKEAPPDVIGRRGGLIALFSRPGLARMRCHHIAFDVDDTAQAMDLIESRGFRVDRTCDAIIHGPEDIWWQIDSRKTPFPVGHPANDPGVRL